MIVDISNCPLTGLKRKVENLKVVINEGEQRVYLACDVLKLKNGEEVMPRHTVTISATTDKIVDEQGNVLKDEQGNPLPPDGVHLTEYGFYMYVAENVSIVFNDLRRKAIADADTSKRFDL